MDKHAPVITKQIQLRNNTLWYCIEIREAKRKQHQAEHRWRKSRLIMHLELVAEARINVNKQVRFAKKKVFQYPI